MPRGTKGLVKSGRGSISGFVWITPPDIMAEVIGQLATGMNDRIAKELVPVASEMQSFMVAMHPWSNQTGRAERGLRARVTREAGGVGIVAYHLAPYGIWLEVKWSGRWGVIPMTISAYGGPIMEATKKGVWNI